MTPEFDAMADDLLASFSETARWRSVADYAKDAATIAAALRAVWDEAIEAAAVKCDPLRFDEEVAVAEVVQRDIRSLKSTPPPADGGAPT